MIEKEKIQSKLNALKKKIFKLEDNYEYEKIDEEIENFRYELEKELIENYNIWSWDSYGVENLRFYVLDDDNICHAIIYLDKFEIIETNEHIKEIDRYFYQEMIEEK